MKMRNAAIVPVVIALLSITLINCGDDDGGGASPPYAPTNPYPGANAKDVATNTVLAWDCSDADGNDLTYDVYLGKATEPPLVGENVTPPYYDPPGSLDTNTKYYWKVVAKDGSHATGGPTWSFTTAKSTGGGGGEEPKTGYTRFLPLNNGNKWTYDCLYFDENGPTGTDEYELLVVDKFDNYHGFESYLVKCRMLWDPPQVTYKALGSDGDKCYLFTSPWWEFIIEDDMNWLAWSQTGLLSWYKLQYNNVGDITVPAGTFNGCKQLQMEYVYESGSRFRYEEWYAEGVGLVYYRYRYDYVSSGWSETQYKLKSYNVTPP
jgi:hypothetical protein